MSSFDYVKEYYGVPADYGRVVFVNSKRGVIIKDCGHYIGVNFDTEKPGAVSICHPTWNVEYAQIEKPRKVTKSQARYQRYLEYGDCFGSFLDFCYWDAMPERSWN